MLRPRRTETPPASFCSGKPAGAGVAQSIGWTAPTTGVQGEREMKAFIVSVAIVSVVISPGGPVLGGLRAAANPAQQMTSARAAQSTPADGGWPRAYSTSSGATLVLYEPQVESWPEQKHMVLYAAVSHLASGAQTRVLGTIRVEAD